MACSCQLKTPKMGKKHHHVKKYRRHHVSGMGDMGSEALEQLMPGLGMIGAHELKGALPASLQTSLGTNYPLIINGVGILAGIGVPMMIKDQATRRYVKPLMAGFAGQCLYSLFLTNVLGTNPPVVNKTWSTYGLGKPNTYALGCMTKNADGSVSYKVMPANNTGNPSGTDANGNPVNKPLNITPAAAAKTPATVARRRVGGGM